MPGKTELPRNFSLLNILFAFRSLEQLTLALKNRVALEFFTVLKYILLFRIFEQLVLALKTEFAPPDPPPRTPMVDTFLHRELFQRKKTNSQTNFLSPTNLRLGQKKAKQFEARLGELAPLCSPQFK